MKLLTFLYLSFSMFLVSFKTPRESLNTRLPGSKVMCSAISGWTVVGGLPTVVEIWCDTMSVGDWREGLQQITIVNYISEEDN